MTTAFKPLDSVIHLHTAAIEQRVVLIFIGAELIGSGEIEEITDDCVKIRGEWYMRSVCRCTKK
jgi:hypothetical protein